MIEQRTSNPQARRHLAIEIAVENILDHAVENVEQYLGPVVELDKTGRKKLTGSCHMFIALPIKRLRKTHKSCDNYQQPVYDEHSN